MRPISGWGGGVVPRNRLMATCRWMRRFSRLTVIWSHSQQLVANFDKTASFEIGRAWNSRNYWNDCEIVSVGVKTKFLDQPRKDSECKSRVWSVHCFAQYALVPRSLIRQNNKVSFTFDKCVDSLEWLTHFCLCNGVICICEEVTKMGRTIGLEIDYNGVGALRGQWFGFSLFENVGPTFSSSSLLFSVNR